MSDGFHPPLEEYLESIHTLGEEGVEVIQARIAERIGRSAPSVSEMLNRLEDDGYIERTGRRVDLTERGADIAQRVVRKHRLAERLLVDVIGLEWHKAHIEAGRWEHVISDDVEERLVALLGNPGTCPHGNPIPGGPTSADLSVQTCLADVRPGLHVRLERVTEVVEIDTDALTYIGERGFIPGSSARVVSVDPEGGVELIVEPSGARVSLDARVCRQLFVVVAGDGVSRVA